MRASTGRRLKSYSILSRTSVYRDREQLGQIVSDLPGTARVGDRDEHLRERHHFPRLHGNPKRRGSYTKSEAVNRGFVNA